MVITPNMSKGEQLAMLAMIIALAPFVYTYFFVKEMFIPHKDERPWENTKRKPGA